MRLSALTGLAGISTLLVIIGVFLPWFKISVGGFVGGTWSGLNEEVDGFLNWIPVVDLSGSTLGLGDGFIALVLGLWGLYSIVREHYAQSGQPALDGLFWKGVAIVFIAGLSRANAPESGFTQVLPGLSPISAGEGLYLTVFGGSGLVMACLFGGIGRLPFFRREKLATAPPVRPPKQAKRSTSRAATSKRESEYARFEQWFDQVRAERGRMPSQAEQRAWRHQYRTGERPPKSLRPLRAKSPEYIRFEQWFDQVRAERGRMPSQAEQRAWRRQDRSGRPE